MGVWLTDLADVCRRTGYPVIELDGWEELSRGGAGGASTDGYQPGHPNHVIVHHTASGPSMDGYPDANYCTYSHTDAPICNLYLSRVPEIYVCAAGASNTNGPGIDYCGIVDDDSMNAAAIGIEAGNDGIGEPWPAVMQDAYVALCAALCAAYGIGVDQVHSHLEWAGPARKIDPAGQSRYASGSDSWDMDPFRADVAAGTLPAPVPPEEDDMAFSCPQFIEATGADGTVAGAVYATDGRFTAIRWLNEWEWQDAQHWARQAGQNPTPERVDRIYSFGALVGPAPS
jgi:hypothetical protein